MAGRPEQKRRRAHVADAIAADRRALRVKLLRAVEHMPMVINRSGVKKASDTNGWYCAQQAALDVIKQVLNDGDTNEREG